MNAWLAAVLRALGLKALDVVKDKIDKSAPHPPGPPTDQTPRLPRF